MLRGWHQATRVHGPGVSLGVHIRHGRAIDHGRIKGDAIVPARVERVMVECAWCGEEFPLLLCPSRRNKRHFCPGTDHHGKWKSENLRGENSPTWRGGDTVYSSEWTLHLRVKIRDRDNHICQLCGAVENGRRLDVHHIDYNGQNCTPGNLVALCHSCHLRTNHNRERWQDYWQKWMRQEHMEELREML